MKNIVISRDERHPVVVYTYDEVCVHRHNATGYKVSDGFLFILDGKEIVATYNAYQWVSVTG